MRKPSPFVAGMLALAAVGLALRLPGLSSRPMHTDEAVEAVKAGALLEGEGWRYDPAEYHGPALPYVSLPFMWISGGADFAETGEATLRLVPVLFGAALLLLAWLLRDGLGGRATLVTVLLCAVSPAMVYYSRYYIHETLLAFFTFGAIVAGWRYVRTESTGWAVLTGAFVGLMHATKETCVIAFLSMAAGLALTSWWGRRSGGAPELKRYLRAKPVAWALGVAVAVSFVLYSSFFTNLRGPLDSLLAYVSFLGRGTLGSHGGDVHCHPWHYYLGILSYAKLAPGPWWSEGGILALAAVGAAAALRPVRADGGEGVAFGLPAGASVGLARFLTFYTLLMTLVYSLIPYKTPWCVLSFLHGMILLAGLGAVVIVACAGKLAARLQGGGDVLWRRALRTGAVPAVACLVALIPLHLARQAHRATTRFQADRRNPYVYAHTAPDLVRLARRVEEIADVSPEGRDMLVEVVAPDVWPLPWYFRGFSRVGYWTEMPDLAGGAFDLGAPVLVLSPEHARSMALELEREYQVGYYGLRPTVHLLLHVRRDLWEEFMKGRGNGG